MCERIRHVRGRVRHVRERVPLGGVRLSVMAGSLRVTGGNLLSVAVTLRVSIVAVLRGGGAIPAPTPDVRLEAGDTLVVVGTTDGISALSDLVGS